MSSWKKELAQLPPWPLPHSARKHHAGSQHTRVGPQGTCRACPGVAPVHFHRQNISQPTENGQTTPAAAPVHFHRQDLPHQSTHRKRPHHTCSCATLSLLGSMLRSLPVAGSTMGTLVSLVTLDACFSAASYAASAARSASEAAPSSPCAACVRKAGGGGNSKQCVTHITDTITMQYNAIQMKHMIQLIRKKYMY